VGVLDADIRCILALRNPEGLVSGRVDFCIAWS
jgi:hypothetical protein